jgi:hypothetical protein
MSVVAVGILEQYPAQFLSKRCAHSRHYPRARRHLATLPRGTVEQAWVGGATSGIGALAIGLLSLDRVKPDGC